MHSDPKQDAQKAEEAGLTAQLVEAAPRSEAVAKMDEPTIEAAREKKQKAQELLEKNNKKRPAPPSTKQDKLDLERATGEGMAPPSHP